LVSLKVGTVRKVQFTGWRSLPFKKAILSIFIILHLTAVGLIPNMQTHLGGRLSFFIEPYANLFLLKTKWGFFAPEPGPPPIFLEWELLDSAGLSLEMGQWPETPSPFFSRERQNRRITAAQSMLDSDGRAERMLVPYLCGKKSLKQPVHSVRLWSLHYSLPPIAEVEAGRRKIGDDVGMVRLWLSHSFCSEYSK
jgi:hypothetical protein